MKIKIVRKYQGEDTVYDIYRGYTKRYWFLYLTAWKLVAENCKYDMLGNYLRQFLGENDITVAFEVD